MLGPLERQSSTQQYPKLKDENLAVAPGGGGCTVLDPIGPNGALVNGNHLPRAPEWIFNGVPNFQSSPVSKGSSAAWTRPPSGRRASSSSSGRIGAHQGDTSSHGLGGGCDSQVKKILLGCIAVFVAWEILDFVIHGLILGPTYATLPNMFWPQAEMKIGLMVVVTLIAAVAFTAVYAWFVNPKSLATGVKFGLVWGFGGGVMMGYGTFASMPVPYIMALVWFLGRWVEFAVAGLLAGLIVKPAGATA